MSENSDEREPVRSVLERTLPLGLGIGAAALILAGVGGLALRGSHTPAARHPPQLSSLIPSAGPVPSLSASPTPSASPSSAPSLSPTPSLAPVGSPTPTHPRSDPATTHAPEPSATRHTPATPAKPSTSRPPVTDPGPRPTFSYVRPHPTSCPPGQVLLTELDGSTECVTLVTPVPIPRTHPPTSPTG